jgi:hypothetical protein
MELDLGDLRLRSLTGKDEALLVEATPPDARLAGHPVKNSLTTGARTSQATLWV